MAKTKAGASDGKLIGEPKGNGKGPVWPYVEPRAEQQQQATEKCDPISAAGYRQIDLERRNDLYALRCYFRDAVDIVMRDGRALGMTTDDVLDFVQGVHGGLAVLDRVMGRV